MNSIEHAFCVSNSRVPLLIVFRIFSWFDTFNRYYVLWCSRMEECTNQIILSIFHAVNHKKKSTDYSECFSRLLWAKFILPLCISKEMVSWKYWTKEIENWKGCTFLSQSRTWLATQKTAVVQGSDLCE